MEFTTLSKAISKINDGNLITFSGMELNRAPMALVYEIAKQSKKNLRTISIPNPLATDVLIKAGCVKHATFGFNGFSFEDGFITAPNWKKSIERNLIEWKETDMLEIIQALKAGSLGISEIEVPYFGNTDYLKFNKYKKIVENGKESIVTNAVNPDFALIHAQYADVDGNIFIEDPLIDKLIAFASKKVIVSVEKIIKHLKNVTLPEEKINCIVKIKNGASPTSCFKFYDYDLNILRKYILKNGNNNNLKTTSTSTNVKPIDNIIVTMGDFIRDGTSVATGVASPIPMIAMMLAKQSGKKFDYFNCGSGAINPVIKAPAYSSVTIKALEHKESFIELPEVWDYALNAKIDLMFFGAVQIAKNGDVNTTCIGDYKNPKVKLPGPAGAVTLRSLCKNAIILTLHHTKKTFMDEVDFVTSGSDKDTIVITNLGILKLGKKPEILAVFPHSSVEEIKENTGFILEDKNAIINKKITKKNIKMLNNIDKKQIRYKIAQK